MYYPSLLTNQNAFPAHIMFTFYERKSTQSSNQTDIVHLYMPEHFNQPNTVQWDSGKSVTAELAAATGGFADSAISAMAPGRMKTFASDLKSAAMKVGNLAGDLGSLAAGGIINPYIAQLFKGVNFRNFTYTFRMVPFSPSDCAVIKNILTTFRKYALPSGPDHGAASPYLQYPGEVEIKYMFCGKENVWIHKFKRSVITNIDIDYTGAGMWTMMRNGFPTETVLNVTLSELDIVVREDVLNGF